MANNSKFFLFNMKNGKKKLAYGNDLQDALYVLSLRLSEEELDQVIKDEYVKIPQRDLQKIVSELG